MRQPRRALPVSDEILTGTGAIELLLNGLHDPFHSDTDMQQYLVRQWERCNSDILLMQDAAARDIKRANWAEYSAAVDYLAACEASFTQAASYDDLQMLERKLRGKDSAFTNVVQKLAVLPEQIAAADNNAALQQRLQTLLSNCEAHAVAFSADLSELTQTLAVLRSSCAEYVEVASARAALAELDRRLGLDVLRVETSNADYKSHLKMQKGAKFEHEAQHVLRDLVQPRLAQGVLGGPKPVR
jgi:hypothetical protein